MSKFLVSMYCVFLMFAVISISHGDARKDEPRAVMTPSPCSILLVDDDNNDPDVQGYFTEALSVMGYTYTVFEVGTGSQNGPASTVMANYDVVIWFSGDKYDSGGGYAGPNAYDEGQLTTYLQGGGSLFLSCQDYLDDMGLTTFGQTYLGISSFGLNASIDPLYGQSGDPVGQGLGPIELTYPTDFIAYPDHLTPQSFASTAFKDIFGQPACIDVDGAGWRTVFFCHPWPPIYNNSLTDGRAVLQAVLDFLCPPGEPTVTPTTTPTPEFSHTPTETPTITPTPLPFSVLLVDDDDDAPDVRMYYTQALTKIGYEYTVYEVGSAGQDGPDAGTLAAYDVVIWFSGDKWSFEDDFAGPNAADEAALTTYLNNGGRLFLNSQDYLWDMGLTTFGQNYLGVSSFDSDSAIEPMIGVSGDPVGGPFGTVFCTFPTGFIPTGDRLTPWAISSTAFNDSQGYPICLDAQNDNWKTVFFAVSWVPAYFEDASVGEAVLESVMNYLLQDNGTLNGHVTLERPGTTPPHASWSVPLTVTLCVGGTSVHDYSCNSDTSGNFSLPLPPGTYDVLVKNSHSLAVKSSNVVISAGTPTVVDFGTVPEGDIDDNNVVLSSDFFILRGAYNTAPGDPGYDARADLNHDDLVTSTDFFLLRTHYNQSGEGC